VDLLMRDLTGVTLGQYEVLERIGAGGMAVVYRAMQSSLGREVALKVLGAALVEDPVFLRRFENEARTVARLDHPNVLPIFDFGTVDGSTYLTMPFVRGGSLKEVLDRGPLTVPQAWKYIQEIGSALHYAHEAGIVHRDMKPANVLIHSDGRALLADFGLARAGDGQMALTSVGFTVGTPGYMSPEQAMGGAIDRRADLYSFSVMVFEMLTGSTPYEGNTPMELVLQTVQAPIPSAVQRNPRLPAELDAVLNLGLAKRPEDRPPTVKDLVSMMGRLPQSAAAPMPAAPPPLPPAFPSPAPGPAVLTPPPGVGTPVSGMPSLAFNRVQAAMEVAPGAALGSALATLELQGIRPLMAKERFALDVYSNSVIRIAREVAGTRWQDVLASAGLPEYLSIDPPLTEARTMPIEDLSRINEAFDILFGADAPDRTRQWGRRTTERILSLREGGETERRAFKLIPGHQRKLEILLKNYHKYLDEVRGEHLHSYKAIDKNQFWLVHFSNLYALGRHRPEKSCHFWVAAYEAMMRWAGLANDWLVSEIECGCVTGTWNCVFAIRSTRD